MSIVTLPPFIKWRDYKSHDKNSPDIIEGKVLDLEKFDTMYSTNVKIMLKENNEYVDRILKLRSFDSDNIDLEKQWDRKTRKIKRGEIVPFKISTYLDKSKKNPTRDIRRFRLDLL